MRRFAVLTALLLALAIAALVGLALVSLEFATSEAAPFVLR